MTKNIGFSVSICKLEFKVRWAPKISFSSKLFYALLKLQAFYYTLTFRVILMCSGMISIVNTDGH